MIRRLIFIYLVTACLAPLCAAEGKNGVVDMARVFTEFNKTKSAATRFQEQVAKVRSDINERYAAYKALLAVIEKLDKEMHDPVVSDEVRAKKSAELQNKNQELRSLDLEIEEFRGRREQQLKQDESQMRKGLYDEIIAVVGDVARKNGCSLVLDKSSVGVSSAPTVLYAEGASDLTDEVIAILNKGAPAKPATDAK